MILPISTSGPTVDQMKLLDTIPGLFWKNRKIPSTYAIYVQKGQYIFLESELYLTYGNKDEDIPRVSFDEFMAACRGAMWEQEDI